MGIKAIIFDMGNTVLRYDPPGVSWRASEEPGIDSLYWEFVGLGYCQKMSREVFIDRWFKSLQKGWNEAVEGKHNLLITDWIAKNMKELRIPRNLVPLEELVAIYAAPRRASLAAMPEAQATLATLRERGYRIGLISNTAWPGRFHRNDLAALGLEEYFDCMLFSSEAEVWKPASAIFQRAAESLDVAVDAAVFVGDNPHDDVLGALNAGMRAVWVANSIFPLTDHQQPHGQISRLGELLPLLEQWT